MADATERTFIMIKPDGVQRGVVGDVIHRFEQRGYKLVGLKLLQVSLRKFIFKKNDIIILLKAPKALLESHYEEHKGKRKTNHFFLSLRVFRFSRKEIL